MKELLLELPMKCEHPRTKADVFPAVAFRVTEKATEIHLRLHEFTWILVADDSLLS